MSAPITACELFDAIGPMLQAVEKSLGCKASLEWTTRTSGVGGFYVVYLHEQGIAFQGIDSTPTRALMAANSQRQGWLDAEKRAKGGDA